ncbi:MAG: hypothetical protein CMO64_06480 [Verrucomicrobiales bacterium]|nr:hypothetical protein [Verrucomicrobiales bacterium]|tara:strand:+ start:3783 stop:4265 length:483 start_codon:yes stop_codon:yes gene_type:complete
MSLILSIEQLKDGDQSLAGELTAEELGLELRDELVTGMAPLSFDLSASQLDDAILVRGRLQLPVDCECARCLRAFTHTMVLDDWALHLPLQGEDAIEPQGDFVDLTPWVREDILLGFPQHPLCAPDCSGLRADGATVPEPGTEADPPPSPWAQLEEWKKE